MMYITTSLSVISNIHAAFSNSSYFPFNLEYCKLPLLTLGLTQGVLNELIKEGAFILGGYKLKKKLFEETYSIIEKNRFFYLLVFNQALNKINLTHFKLVSGWGGLYITGSNILSAGGWAYN